MSEETRAERLDRELGELLQELRVILPGVQVLLAFLLTAPFQQRFGQLPGAERNAFFAAIVFATLATVLLIAPSAHHRLRWRAGDKERLLRVGNQMAIWGTVFLGVAIVLALYVVTNILFASNLALLTAGAAAVVFAAVWYALPFAGRMSAREEYGEPGRDQDSRGASSRR
jgi:hypothetical protein